MRIVKAENGYTLNETVKTKSDAYDGYEYSSKVTLFFSWDTLVEFLKNNPLTENKDD